MKIEITFIVENLEGNKYKIFLKDVPELSSKPKWKIFDDYIKNKFIEIEK